MALIFIAQSVASAIIENLVNKCLSYLEAYPVLRGVQDELNRLHYALPQVQDVLTAVEEGAVQKEGLRRWLWQLRDAVENAEDVLDELDYYKLEKSIQDRDDKERDEMMIDLFSKFKKITFDRFFNRKFSDDTLKRLREAVEGLDRVVAGIGPFLQIAVGFYGPKVKRQKLEEVKNARETSCLLTESEVVGRDNERDLIVEWLIKPVDGESEGITFNISAFTIVGMGGLGKTTLAQLIYQDERVQRYFDDQIMWVCVSQDFNANMITKKILEAIDHGSSDDKHYLNTLHEDLKQKLTSKRFLLILDDVWDGDNMMEWEKLVAPLKFGQRGSKILLTTRMASVVDMAARVMQCKKESLNLNKLEKNDYMSLFNKHAFFNVNPDDYKNLQPIGQQIAKKLGGCPLAIKVMGGLLNSYLDYDSWERFLEEDTMKLQQGKSDIMTVLRLSYDHLPIHIQVCFRYCSIFQQDHRFKRKELVEMWIGSGLIPQSIYEGQRSPEDIGKEYFDLLTRNSFFTYNGNFYYEDGFSKHYVMHDLLHDLAQFVSRGECIRIQGDVAGNIIPVETVRHLSFENINFLSIGAISKLKNLRTLIISAEENDEHHADHLLEFNEVIKGFKNLRLLSLIVYCYSYKLPDKLDSLLHLRYLSLSGYLDTNEHILDSFNSTLRRLYHLEFLKFNIYETDSDIIEFDGLANLVSLRSFDLSTMTKRIPFVGKLTSIRKLEDFLVQEKSGYKISELNDLRELRHLSITGLENVRTSKEAMEAKLKDKNYLKSLSLQWSRDRSNSAEADEKLLDNLRPHTNLKKLDIKEYQGVKSPCWMRNLSLVNLTFIALVDCKGWEHLPPLGRLQSLNTLHMTGMHAVKQIGGGGAFPSLKNLVFEDMPNLEEWIGIDDCCVFPKLHTMKITKCPNLRGLPALPRCLNQLQIKDVGLTTLPAINENCGNNNQQKQFSDPESTLIIEDCEKLQYLPTEFFQKFNTIKVLRIKNCPELEEWIGIDDCCIFPKLHTMRIIDCPNLRGLPALSHCLNQLQIEDVGLTTLPAINENCRNNNQQKQFSDPESTLIIEDCEKLQYLPTEFFQKFNTIKVLRIKNCPELEEWIGIDDCCIFPKLHTMRIIDCPNLRGLPALSQCLNQLQIEDVGLTTFPAINENCRNNNQQEEFSALETLTIKQCEKLEYLPTELFQKFNTLKALSIQNCPKLTTRGISGIKLPSILDERTIGSCGDLEVPLLWLANLTSLNISGQHAVKKIDSSLFGSSHGCAFPSLKDLIFQDLPNLEEWIGIDDGCMFPQLRSMKITSCPNLSRLPALPQCLNKLHIEDVGLSTLPAIENCGNNNQQEQFLALETLTIKQCKKLQYLPTVFFQKFNTLEELRIEDCPKWTIRGISNIQQPSILDERTTGSCGDLEVLLLCSANLTSLTISGLHGVKKIGSSFFGSSRGCAFPSLEDLIFEDLPNLEEWIGIDDCCMFPKLDSMKIINCPNLSGLPTLPCSLRKLHISNVGLTALPAIDENCGKNNQQEHFQGLKYLTIKKCGKLKYIPPEYFQKFNTVKFLRLTNCPKLKTRGISDIRPPSILDKLTIESCGDLEVHLLQLLPNLTSLPQLELVDCASITSLPPAQVCARWAMISRLEIKNCKEMSSFGGIQALVCLHELEITGCDKLIEVSLRQPPFPNDVGQKNAVDCFLKLGKLSIDHHALLLMEPLRSLSSISCLILSDASRLTSLPEEWLLQNHSALNELDIWNACSLQSIPQSMTQLCSLESLVVRNAKFIQSLPDLPTSLHFLWISGCHPELKERCQENIGLDWPKIANIPYGWIYNQF